MQFDHPGYLWGMLVGLIPILIHLIQRRRSKIVEFAAMEFILASNKRMARRYRVREMALLALRMLLLAALPFAFAKPSLVTAAPSLPGAQAPSSVVIVIDPSGSMGYLTPDGTLLKRAIERARAIVSDLRNESDAAVVVAQSPAKALTTRLTYDRRLLLDVLGTIGQTAGRADLLGALRLAEQILVESSHDRREVVVLTDLQATEWEGMTRPWSLDRSPAVTLVDVSDGAKRRNTAIIKVAAEPVSGSASREVTVSVDVLNDRTEVTEDVVTVRVGDKTAKGIVRLGPHETVTKTFSMRLPDQNTPVGTAEIGTDDLAFDNVRPFVVAMSEKIDVLVVNGAARAVPHRDETFFLRAALRPAADAPTRTSPTFIRPEELTAAALDAAAVVVLANVAELDAGQIGALDAWVQRGGGLFITTGDNVTKDTWGGSIGTLGPLPVRGLQDMGKEPVYFATPDTEHPMLSVFRALPDASLLTARVRKYTLLDTAARGADTRVLLSYTDGAPALVERRVGQGHVLMFTTSIDRDWNELPFKTSYLPLVQQAMAYLASVLDQARVGDIVAGQVETIPVPDGLLGLAVVGPTGAQTHYGPSDLGAGDIRYRETATPGVYSVVEKRQHGEVTRSFVVGTDARESVLASADMTATQTLLETGSAQTSGAPVHTPVHRADAWPMILVALFVLLGFETILAIRRR